MCCVFTVLLFLGPRVANVTWWLLAPGQWVGEAAGAFNGILLPILGIIFLPWTTLMYVAVHHPVEGVSLLGWLFVALGVFADISMHGGGAYFNRDSVPGMSSAESA